MIDSRHIGRVGGPACGLVGGFVVAVGCGAAVLSGAGLASADRGDAGATISASPGSESPATGHVRGRHPEAGRPRPIPPAAARRASVMPSGAFKASKMVTVNPVVSFADGVLYGQLNASSARGLGMRYTAVGGLAGGSNGGKLTLGTNIYAPINEQGFTLLPYRTWNEIGVGKSTEDWRVRVSEITRFDQMAAAVPVVGKFATPVISMLQRTPLVGVLLAPLIGTSVLATVTADVRALAPGTTPLSYTYKVTSFDGTPISTNFFPAVGLVAGDTAPTVLNGPGLGNPGETDPFATCRDCANSPEKTAVGALRTAGYNAVTWDPRGEFNSGGVFQLDNPFYEGRDVAAIVSWVATDTPAELDGPGDPRIGMIGGSLGGGIQVAYASTEPRIEAITPDITWNSLGQSLYPSGTFKTYIANLLLLALVVNKARVNTQFYAGILTGDLFGRLSETSQALLADSGPAGLLSKLTAPTLLTQGTVDILFPLNQSLLNAQGILGNGTTAKLIWYCGGHGWCADPVGPNQAATIRQSTMAWLDQYVARAGNPADTIPNFQWFDQLGGYYTSSKLPYQPGFNDRAAVTATSDGGRLVIAPLLGGSGPGAGPLLIGLAGGSPARNAIDVALTVPSGTQVVGAPTLSFSYKGLGNSRAVFAQVVDNSTNRVLGQIITPIPVTLDGKQHQVSVDLNDIVYTYGGTKPGSLTLQITSSATAYANPSIGFISLSDISVSLPNRTTA